MHLKMNALSFALAKAWAPIGSMIPVELFDNQGNNLGVRDVKFIPQNLCELDNNDYVMYEKVKDESRPDELIVFLVKTENTRNTFSN